MGKVKDDNYYITYGWMINQLQLKGNELQIFAIIYGFSQNNKKAPVETHVFFLPAFVTSGAVINLHLLTVAGYPAILLSAR